MATSERLMAHIVKKNRDMLAFAEYIVKQSFEMLTCVIHCEPSPLGAVGERAMSHS